MDNDGDHGRSEVHRHLQIHPKAQLRSWDHSPRLPPPGSRDEVRIAHPFADARAGRHAVITSGRIGMTPRDCRPPGCVDLNMSPQRFRSPCQMAWSSFGASTLMRAAAACTIVPARTGENGCPTHRAPSDESADHPVRLHLRGSEEQEEVAPRATSPAPCTAVNASSWAPVDPDLPCSTSVRRNARRYRAIPRPLGMRRAPLSGGRHFPGRFRWFPRRSASVSDRSDHSAILRRSSRGSPALATVDHAMDACRWSAVLRPTSVPGVEREDGVE